MLLAVLVMSINIFKKITDRGTNGYYASRKRVIIYLLTFNRQAPMM